MSRKDTYSLSGPGRPNLFPSSKSEKVVEFHGGEVGQRSNCCSFCYKPGGAPTPKQNLRLLHAVLTQCEHGVAGNVRIETKL